uniref:SFRICE_015698 n=1 Tax=Spodoptera frugiperda TaxID=7108 RepID=A0A2H1W4Z9_SPOFR
MVQSEGEWDAVFFFCEAVMLAKEEAKRVRERFSSRLSSRRRYSGPRGTRDDLWPTAAAVAKRQVLVVFQIVIERRMPIFLWEFGYECVLMKSTPKIAGRRASGSPDYHLAIAAANGYLKHQKRYKFDVGLLGYESVVIESKSQKRSLFSERVVVDFGMFYIGSDKFSN